MTSEEKMLAMGFEAIFEHNERNISCYKKSFRGSHVSLYIWRSDSVGGGVGSEWEGCCSLTRRWPMDEANGLFDFPAVQGKTPIEVAQELLTLSRSYLYNIYREIYEMEDIAFEEDGE